MLLYLMVITIAFTSLYCWSVFSRGSAIYKTMTVYNKKASTTLNTTNIILNICFSFLYSATTLTKATQQNFPQI